MLKCSKCGRENDDSFTFCLDCGNPLKPGAGEDAKDTAPTPAASAPAPAPAPTPAPTPAAPAPAAPPAEPKAAAATCPKCGTALQAGCARHTSNAFPCPSLVPSGSPKLVSSRR